MSKPVSLDGFATKQLYLYIYRRQSGNLGYYDLTYRDMAEQLGLPWRHGSDNAQTVLLIRAALVKLERLKFIKVKTGEKPGAVRMLLRVNPNKLSRERGWWYLDECLGVNLQPDPWAPVWGTNG